MNKDFDCRMLINALEKEQRIDKDELVQLLSMIDAVPLFEAADRVRKRFVGEDVHLRGLIEFSNYCCRSCAYCGLRAANSKVKRYRMEPEEILMCAKRAVDLGLKTIVLQSGEDKRYAVDDLCRIVNRIKGMDVAVTLSMGEFSRKEYAALKDAGADRYLLRIETTHERLYQILHPGMSFQNRVRCLHDLKELGYETGTGCLIGIPGQTQVMLAEDLLFFKGLDADMIGMGPFIPCPDTPLGSDSGGDTDTVLRMLALARLLMPDINLPATTALGVRARDGYQKGLSCGANVIMPNMGKAQYKKLYTIYPGKGESVANQENNLDTIKSVVMEMGRRIGRSHGSRKGFTREGSSGSVPPARRFY